MNCPICHKSLQKENKTWRCENGHCFDQARQGYLNLSRKQKQSGDNKQMSKARSVFLESGAYAFLRDALKEEFEQLALQSWIDLGCGEGYYTRELSKGVPEAFGIDLSKSSIAHAAGRDKETQYIVGTIFELPFDDETFDLETSIFTPVPQKEILRTLKPGGRLITVTPGAKHHAELKKLLYTNTRDNEEPEDLDGFVLESRQELLRLVHVDDPWTLLEMTPYRYTSPKEGLDAVAACKDGLDITFDFLIRTWRKPDACEH